VSVLAAAAAVIFAARVVLQANHGGESGASRSSLTSGAHAFATGVGKRDSLRLPDGGRVVLGPSSQLVVAAEYGQRVREVELHGEAYFDVVHDTTHPFVVHVGEATIRDIGTSFAVRGDSGRPVQVVVTSGSVALRARVGADSGAVLTAGAIGTLQPTGSISVRRDASTAPYLAWMRDSLVFRDASFDEVSSDLRRWYGVVLRAGDPSLTQRHLTMTFSGDSLNRVLRVISLGLGAEIERRGDTAVVRSSARSGRPQ
jgi:transmembrane sensor